MSSTRTLVTLLRPWIRRFTIIISAWWLRTSSKFTWEEVKTSTGKLGKWSTPKRVRILPKYSAPSLSRDRRIKMHQSINQSITCVTVNQPFCGFPEDRENKDAFQRWSRGHKARGQGQGQPFRGQTLSRPRTGIPRTQAQKKRSPQKFFRRSQKKKKGLHKNFSSDLHKKTFPKKFSSAPQNFNNSKNSAVLEPRTGQFSRT